MSWLLPAFAAVAALLWLGRRRGGEWRPAAAVVAAALFVAAAATGVRGQYLLCGLLLLAGGFFAVSARRALPSQEEARRLLGVGPDASPEDIRTAHRRLIRAAHPDAGGDSERAARLNAARDRLLK